jgi:hypothetical protein
MPLPSWLHPEHNNSRCMFFYAGKFYFCIRTEISPN